MLNYSETELFDIIIWHREGLSWDEVSKKFSLKYRQSTGNALRKTYERYGHLHDISEETALLEKLKELVRMKKTNSKLAKENRLVLDTKMAWDDVEDSIKRAVKSVALPALDSMTPSDPSTKDHMIVEALMSDLHIGLLYGDFNLEVARERLIEFSSTLIGEIKRLETLYTIDKIIVALMGDIINSSTMHGEESAKDCEVGNAEQVFFGIKLLYEHVLVPLSQFGIPVYFPCVPGNHDRVERARTFVHPGKHYLSYTIYHTLKMMAEQAGMDNFIFEITDGSYIVSHIYDNTVLYEHGDNLRSNAQKSVDTLIHKRERQTGQIIDFFRAGHLHEYLVYGRGRIVMNASLCGESSFSHTLGFNSVASQTINTYVKTDVRPTCFYKSFSVYLGG